MRYLSMLGLVLCSTAITRGQDRPEPRRERPNVERIFNALDADQDGKIDRTELERKLPEIMERLREHRPGQEARREGRDEPGKPRDEQPQPPRKVRPDAERTRPAADAPPAGPGGPPPEMTERMNQIVERRMREMIERRMPEIKQRIEQLVERKVREILSRERPDPAAPPSPRAMQPMRPPFEQQPPFGWRDRPAFRYPMGFMRRPAFGRQSQRGWWPQAGGPMGRSAAPPWADRAQGQRPRPCDRPELDPDRPCDRPDFDRDRPFDRRPGGPAARGPDRSRGDRDDGPDDSPRSPRHRPEPDR